MVPKKPAEGKIVSEMHPQIPNQPITKPPFGSVPQMPAIPLTPPALVQRPMFEPTPAPRKELSKGELIIQDAQKAIQQQKNKHLYSKFINFLKDRSLVKCIDNKIEEAGLQDAFTLWIFPDKAFPTTIKDHCEFILSTMTNDTFDKKMAPTNIQTLSGKTIQITDQFLKQITAIEVHDKRTIAFISNKFAL